MPFRRDCRLCVEEMGQDHPHRRQKGVGGESVYVLSVDLTGPYVKGTRLGTGHKAKYMTVATVPVPLASRQLVVEKPRGEGDHGGDQDLRRAEEHGDKVRPGDGEDEKRGEMAHDLVMDLNMELREAKGYRCLRRNPSVNGCPILLNQSQNLVMNFLTRKTQPENLYMIGVRNQKLLEQVNDKWRKHCEVCTERVETQNLFAVLTGIPQRVWFHIVSKSGWMGPVVVAMCLPAGVKAEPGGDDGGWDYVMDVLMVLGFVGYSVLAMGLGAMLARAFERIRWQAGQLRNILAALPGTSPSPE